MTELYKDPKNLDEIVDKIKTLPNIKSIIDLLHEIYPNWILYYLKRYSTDYPHLQANWEYSCKEKKVRPAQIIVVDFFKYTDEHKLLNIFSEIFTLSGFIVRSKDDIIPCEKCNCAIPTLSRYEQMKTYENLALDVTEWSSKCSTC